MILVLMVLSAMVLKSMMREEYNSLQEVEEATEREVVEMTMMEAIDHLA